MVQCRTSFMHMRLITVFVAEGSDPIVLDSLCPWWGALSRGLSCSSRGPGGLQVP